MFVAGFIGSPSMNFFEGLAQDGALVFDGLRLPAPAGVGLEDGQKVVCGVRPEHLMLGQNGFDVKVAVVEPTGSETHVMARHGRQEVIAVFRERHAFDPDQTITLEPDLTQIHLFDGQTGMRIGLPG